MVTRLPRNGSRRVAPGGVRGHVRGHDERWGRVGSCGKASPTPCLPQTPTPGTPLIMRAAEQSCQARASGSGSASAPLNRAQPSEQSNSHRPLNPGVASSSPAKIDLSSEAASSERRAGAMAASCDSYRMFTAEASSASDTLAALQRMVLTPNKLAENRRLVAGLSRAESEGSREI